MSFRKELTSIFIGLVVIAFFAFSLSGRMKTVDRAHAALRLAQNLGVQHNDNPAELHGLYPEIFPGGYDGAVDITFHDKPATLETVVVAIVRWAGWDTVHYDNKLIHKVKPHVSPDGFPYYSPDPTPRSIPYVVVALEKGLIADSDLPNLRNPVDDNQIDRLSNKAKQTKQLAHITMPLILDAAGIAQLRISRPPAQQVIVLPSGFTNYELLKGLPNRILDLNAPSLRLFNGSSSFSDGKQDHFPLGPLETQLSVGLRVPETSYSHQAEAIYGVVENESSTVNAVGIWGAAKSMKKGARVWGGFLTGQTPAGAASDAQVIGLEVDVINGSLPGAHPNRSKTGIQVVGIGTAPVTNAIEIIGAGPAKWNNGILFTPGSVTPHGAVLGVSGPGTVGRGIDFSGVKFQDSAILLGQGSTLSFLDKAGARSAIYTDDFGRGHFVLRAGADGLRVTSHDDSKNLAHIDSRGNILTPFGNFEQIIKDVDSLKTSARDAGATKIPVPRTSKDACTTGNWAADSSYVYVCVAANTWKRATLSSW